MAHYAHIQWDKTSIMEFAWDSPTLFPNGLLFFPAVMASARYQCDSIDLKNKFEKAEYLQTEKLTNRTFVPHTHCRNCRAPSLNKYTNVSLLDQNPVSTRKYVNVPELNNLTNPTMHQQISHNAPFCNRNVHTCAHFCYKMVHCGIWNWSIVRFVQYVS